MTVPLQHNPQSSLTNASGLPTLNKVLTTQYTNQSTATGFTEPTFFDVQDTESFSLSVQEVDGAGDPVGSPAANFFLLQLFRSLDNGYSWQLFASYTAQTEIDVPCKSRNIIWQFRLTTKGTNNIRVRART